MINNKLLQNHGHDLACNDYVHEVSLSKDHHEQRKYVYLINEHNSTKNWWSAVKECRDLMIPLSPNYQVKLVGRL